MSGIAEKLRGLDSFGSPVSVGYRGSSVYKTLFGSLFSILIATFMLVYVVVTLIDVLGFKSPQITQVS